ncbi:unnamed protein product [Chironomus riparius]|uniref:GB1/RHD3-type G domain-containing protein n=1 Tax=Chironomus riparius TaxID=315576 RepID=A0A9N9S9Y5_9DIPT|nr:unnamed protein product [Chironomus riparius]
MSSHEHPHGRPENVLGFTEDSKVFIHDAPLKDMFLHPDVKHRKIVAFSIIGAYRKGKSFFLNYCLRYLYAHYPSIKYPNNPVSDPDNWLGKEDEPLVGFTWKSGSSRVTTGIDMWNDIFLHKDEISGEEIGIILMDTHGLFDNETSGLDNSRIFTLGTLISSIQVLNLSGVIQDDQLQYIQFATECAKFTFTQNQDSTGKCFQNLIFLIRDWANPDEFDYGIEGGKKYLDHFQKTMRTQKMDLQYICDSIYNSFENITCSLLPHPGKIVSTGKNGLTEYDGSWSKMDEEFQDELKALISHILNPQQLGIKKVDGCVLTGEEYLNFIQVQFEVFQTDEALQAQTVYDSTIKKEMEKLIRSCLEQYKDLGHKGKGLVNTEDDLEALHRKCKSEALKTFDDSKKLGGPEDFTKFRMLLKKRVEKTYEEIKTQIINERIAIEEAKEKLRLEMEQKQRIEVERIEREKKAAEERLEVEKQKAKEKLELEEKLKEQEIAKLNEQAEQERKALEEQKERQKQEKEETIKTIEDEVEAKRIQIENAKKIKEAEEEERKKEEKLEIAAIKLTDEVLPEVPEPNYPKLDEKPQKPEISNIQNNSSSSNERNNFKPSLNSSSVGHTSNKFLNEGKFEITDSIKDSNQPGSSTSSSSHQPNTFKHDTQESTRTDQKQMFPTSSGFVGDQQLSCTAQNQQKATPKHLYKSTVVAATAPLEYGEPKNVINFQGSGTPTIDTNELAKMFEHPNVRDRKIAVIVASGNNKQERSFFLDACLKFLYFYYESIKHNRTEFRNFDHWNAPENNFDTGFLSYYRKHHEVAGVIIWNDVFVHEDDIAVVVMDFHGIFEKETNPYESSKLFIFASLISSLQVLNLSHSDPKKYLKNLKYASEFGQFSNSGGPQNFFQNIHFILRDSTWFGIENGKKYFDDLFHTRLYGKSDLNPVRELIRNSFDDYDCTIYFKLPINIIPNDNLLHPSNILLKKINGEFVTAIDYFEYLQLYIKSFRTYGLPSPQTIFQNNNGKQIVNSSYNHFIKYVITHKDRIGDENILHNFGKEDTISYLKSLCRGKGIDYSSFIETINKKINALFQLYLTQTPENLQIVERECRKAMKSGTEDTTLLPKEHTADYSFYETNVNWSDLCQNIQLRAERNSSGFSIDCRIS